MSDCFKSTLDYLDKETTNIVNGYIRNAQFLLLSSFNYIPKEINHITLSYVDDHFMLYRGTYQWILTNSLLNKMLNAQHGAKFSSDTFEIGKLHWIIEVYPNGNHFAGHFVVFITLLPWPIKWNFMEFACSIHVAETNTKVSSIMRLSATELSLGWLPGTLLLNEVINANPDKLTITVTNKILRIVANPTYKMQSLQDCIIYQSPINNYRKHYKFDFTINRLLLTSDQDWHRDKSFHSDIIGEIFSVKYYPSHNKIGLKLLGLPNQINGEPCFVSAIQVKWNVHIKETDINMMGTKKLDHVQNYYELVISSFTFDDFKKYESVTFHNNIEILNECDVSGNVVGIDVDIDDVWNKYVSKSNKIDIKREADTKGTNNNNELCATRDELCVIREQIQRWEQKMDEIIERNNTEQNAFKLWLFDEVKLAQYYDILHQNGYDNMNAISTVTLDELEQIGINKIGHRHQLMAYISKFRWHNVVELRNKLVYIVLGILVLFFAVLCGRWSV